MGTKTIGNTATPTNTTINESGLAQWRPGSPLTMTEDSYIDGVFWYIGGFGSSTNLRAVMWRTDNVLVTSGGVVGVGDPESWVWLPYSNIQGVAAGVAVFGGVWASNGSTIRGHSGGHYWVQQGGVSGPSNFSGSQDTYGFASEPGWYFTYFPSVQVTGLTSTPVAPGQNFTITGRSFQVGVTSISLNGTPVTSWTVNSDSQITAVVPLGATSGQVTVNTVANSATSAGVLTISSAYLIRSGAASSSQGVFLTRASAQSQAQGVLRYKGGAWIDAQ